MEPREASEAWSNRLRHASVVSTITLASGLAMALAYGTAEAIANPGYSLIDGYWRGALPWIGVVESLVVGGATAGVVIGTTAVVVAGGPLRRLLAVALAAVAGAWWFLAWIGAGVSGVPCVGCPPAVPDPWAYAYSSPLLTVQMLITPAIVIGWMAAARRVPIARV